MDKAGLYGCAFSEFRRLGVGSCMVEAGENEYEVHWSGFKRKREYGVGIAIKVQPGIEIGEIKAINERLMTAAVEIFGLSMKLISAYAPTEPGKESAKMKFYQNLKKIKPDHPDQKLVYLGDFNATTDAVRKTAGVRAGKILENITSNDNGERLIEFSRNNNLSILNTFFKQPLHRQVTWHSRDKWKTKKTLDYQICSDWLRQYCKNCRVYNGFKFQTDHRILISSWRTPVTKRARFVKRKKGTSSIKFDLTGLRNGQLTSKFVEKVDECVPHLPGAESDLEKLFASVIDALETAAAQSLPPYKKSDHQYPVWSTDPNFKQLIAERDLLGSQSKCIKLITKKIRKRAKILKNQHFRKQAEEIEALSKQKKYREMYQQAKSQVSTFKKIRVKLEPEKGLKFFKSHFNPTPPTELQTPKELQETPKFVPNLQKITESIKLDSSPPTVIEVHDFLQRLKSNKSSCDVPPEFLKFAAASGQFIELFHQMTTEIWTQKKVPTKFGHGKLEALFKNKGSNKLAKNFRGLNIGSCVGKVVLAIILDRMKLWYTEQLSYHQCGFRPGMGTTDAIYCLKRAMQISTRKLEPLFIIFCDLSAAFDHCVRAWLFKSIRMRFPKDYDMTLIDILENLYSNTSCEMDGDLFFMTTSGVRQGGPESPWLYTLFADFVMRCFLERCSKHPEIKFFKHKFNIPSYDVPNEFDTPNVWEQFLEWLGYADDTALFLKDGTAIQLVYDIYEQVLTEFFLKVNPTKTKTQIVNFKSTPDYTPESVYPTSLIKASNGTEMVDMENVEVMRYLGADNDRSEAGTGWTELNNRMDSARTTFAINKNLFCNYKLSLHLRINFLNSLVRSRLVYGCQNWALTKAQYERLDGCYRTMLRKLVRGGFERSAASSENDKKLKYHYNTEGILLFTKTENISTFVKRQQRNYAAHLIRTSNSKPTKQFMFNNDKYRKPGNHAPELLQQVVKQSELTRSEFLDRAASRKF